MISPKIIRLPQCSPFSECIAAMHQNIKMSNIHKITNTWYPFDIALNLSNNVKRFTSSLPIGYTSVPQNEQKDESSAIFFPHIYRICQSELFDRIKNKLGFFGKKHFMVITGFHFFHQAKNPMCIIIIIQTDKNITFSYYQLIKIQIQEVLK